MGRHRPGSPRDRALGAELRAIREATGKSLSEVAAAIKWDISLLSRMERGLRHISPEAVMGLSVVYDLPAPRRNELVAWASKPVALGWWDRPPAGVPSDLGALASYEHEAARMTDWSPGIIPGLLQTPGYMTAVMRDWGVPEKDVNSRIGARLQRQQLLDRRDVNYLALVGITALTNHLGSAAVMQEQLRHLLRVSQRTGVTLRVVAAPTSFIACGWYLMDYEKAGSVVLLEHLGSSTFLFDEETTAYAVARKDLRDRALSERSTRDRIEQLIEQHVLGS